MFTASMTEKDAEEVQITDVPYGIFKEMIHYIYTEETPKLNDVAYDLLQAADKYELEDLKSKCEQKLMENLSVENAVIFLILADRHSAHDLKATALKFFRQ